MTSKTETQTATTPTVHGKVEYPVVECTSCGQETMKENAHRFVVGELDEQNIYDSLEEAKYKFDATTVREGWACPYCRDDP